MAAGIGFQLPSGSLYSSHTSASDIGYYSLYSMSSSDLTTITGISQLTTSSVANWFSGSLANLARFKNSANDNWYIDSSFGNSMAQQSSGSSSYMRGALYNDTDISANKWIVLVFEKEEKNGIRVMEITAESSYTSQHTTGTRAAEIGLDEGCFLVTGGTQVSFSSWIDMPDAPSGYSITYSTNGGTLESGISNPTLNQTSLPNPLPNCTKTNRVFSGWYTDSTFTTPAVAGSSITSNTTLYAKYGSYNIDITTLPGYANLPDGTYTITARVSATGKAMSDPSTGVSYTKGSAMPTKGQIINLDMDGNGNAQYRVLNVNGSNVEVVSMDNVGTSKFDISRNTYYSGSTLDTHLNTTYYNTLTTTAKAAIVDKNITQYQYESTRYSKSVKANVGNRHIYVLDIDDIETYLGKSMDDFTSTDIWKMFWNDEVTHSGDNLWLRSAYNGGINNGWRVAGVYGRAVNGDLGYNNGVRAAFVIDLSKISWS